MLCSFIMLPPPHIFILCPPSLEFCLHAYKQIRACIPDSSIIDYIKSADLVPGSSPFACDSMFNQIILEYIKVIVTNFFIQKHY